MPQGDRLGGAGETSIRRGSNRHRRGGHLHPVRQTPQLGQGRGGFYSYDFLENLAGCDIHSADRIIPGWQDIKIGDEVRLAPAVGLSRICRRSGRPRRTRPPGR
jgi:hypothetical protein